MEKKYRITDMTTSLIKYHFVFCPRYRRKIFLVDGVETRFRELVNFKCEEMEIEVIDIRCDKDHAYLFLNCPPEYSAYRIMQQLKCYTSTILLKEFEELSKMPNLWTKNYFVSTEEMQENEITIFVERQRKKY